MSAPILIEPQAIADGPTPPFDAAAAATAAAKRHEALEAIARACGRIAPLWPLKHFVAVNPFLGFSGERFGAACARMRRVTGAEMLMPRAFFRTAVAERRITDADLAAALAAAELRGKVPASVEALKQALAADPAPAAPAVATVAEVLDRSAGMRVAPLAVEEIAKWCAAYWDEGQAAWRMPWRSLRPYKAWRAAARHDRTPEAMGLSGFRAVLDELPENPVATIETVLETLGLSGDAVEAYLHRALAGIGGWAAYARYLAWNKELHGETDDTLVHLLAIRLTWDGALFALHRDDAFRTAWTTAAQAMASGANTAEVDPDLAADAVLQDAYERAFQRVLLARLAATVPKGAAEPRKAVQAAFCIDVRSEVYRRAFETLAPEADTIGFAGFFGFPIEYVPIGQARGGAQCPVLLIPRFVVCEAVKGASEAEEAAILDRRVLRRRAAKAWKAFKTSAVSSFAYVETAGLLFGAKLVGDGAGLTRTVAHPSTEGLGRDVLRRVGPRLASRLVGGRQTGFAPDEQVAMAVAVLRAMSMTGGFARLVLLAGHGSTTVNNPHASGLDCGACGGHTGEANARIAAAILNDPAVRAGLEERGLAVPEDTWFLGALHDTTTDQVTLFDLDEVPASHAPDLDRLRGWLRAASTLARAERATLLGIAQDADVDAQVMRRSRDWSQVRPEWGLAGNAAFVAAPRERTRGLDLSGRAFLHGYDWRKDADFGVLELIMTAPMVVASWINLQYYGSTVNNRAFGSGNKTLHNVTGQLGVLEGNAGDLKVGLPLQSVHDGTRFVHEPLRLNVFIEAPEAEIDRVIAKHESVRRLVDNGWVHLFAFVDEGRTIRRYLGELQWQSV